MSLVTQMAPDFTAGAVLADGTIGNVTLSDFRGQYVLLFFYPLDFTFVCPTELIAFDRAAKEFEKRCVQLMSVSVDSVYSHFAWRSTCRKDGGVGALRYPMVSDLSKVISREYGVLTQDETVALRGLFLIDRVGVVRHELINDLSLGRSVDEALRMVEALQFFEKHGDVCPANWHEGEDAIKPSQQGVSDYLAKHDK